MKNFRLSIYDWDHNEDLVLTHLTKNFNEFENDVKLAFKIASDILLISEIDYIGNIELPRKAATILCEEFGYSFLKEDGYVSISIQMTGIIRDDGSDLGVKKIIDIETFNKIVEHNRKVDEDIHKLIEK